MISEHGDKEPEFLKKKKKGEIILQARQGKCVKRKLVGTGDLGSFWCHGEHGAGAVSPPPHWTKARDCKTASHHIYRFKLKNVVRAAVLFSHRTKPGCLQNLELSRQHHKTQSSKQLNWVILYTFWWAQKRFPQCAINWRREKTSS